MTFNAAPTPSEGLRQRRERGGSRDAFNARSIRRTASGWIPTDSRSVWTEPCGMALLSTAQWRPSRRKLVEPTGERRTPRPNSRDPKTTTSTCCQALSAKRLSSGLQTAAQWLYATPVRKMIIPDRTNQPLVRRKIDTTHPPPRLPLFLRKLAQLASTNFNFFGMPLIQIGNASDNLLPGQEPRPFFPHMRVTSCPPHRSPRRFPPPSRGSLLVVHNSS